MQPLANRFDHILMATMDLQNLKVSSLFTHDISSTSEQITGRASRILLQ